MQTVHISEYPSSRTEDSLNFLHDISWENYQHLIAIRGTFPTPRINYLQGELEFMSPTIFHEDIKSKIGCLIEVYCLEKDIPFRSLGSWTLQSEHSERGAEPDECYIFGTESAERPHLVIEVIWTSGRINKLEIYRKLEIPEVWFWRQDRIQVYVLRNEYYAPIAESEVLPGLDVRLLTSFLEQPTTYAAIRGYRAALRTKE